MKTNLKKEDIMIIERKFKNFYNHISKLVHKYFICYKIDKSFLFIYL